MRQYFGSLIVAKKQVNTKNPDQVPGGDGMIWVNRAPQKVREVILLERHDTFVSSASMEDHYLIICDLNWHNTETRTGKPPTYPIASNKAFVGSFDPDGMVSRFLHEHANYLTNFARCVGEYDLVVAYVNYER